MEPIFHYSFLGNTISVFPDRIEQKIWPFKRISIPLQQISSAQVNTLIARVTIDTTSGKSHMFHLITPARAQEFHDVIQRIRNSK